MGENNRYQVLATMSILTCIALDVVERVLDFILCWNILPGSQENTLVHLTILSEENIHRDQTRKVEDVNVVLNGNLQHKFINTPYY